MSHYQKLGGYQRLMSLSEVKSFSEVVVIIRSRYHTYNIFVYNVICCLQFSCSL